jgi:hypothetical protein
MALLRNGVRDRNCCPFPAEEWGRVGDDYVSAAPILCATRTPGRDNTVQILEDCFGGRRISGHPDSVIREKHPHTGLSPYGRRSGRASTGVGKRLSCGGSASFGVSMAGYIWDLSGIDGQCAAYGTGHLIQWIHFNHSMRESSVVIPVTASWTTTVWCTARVTTCPWCGGITDRRCCE